MSSQIQGLIDKIKSEGVDAARQQAKEIEEHAQSDAKKIIEKAESQAVHILANAKEEIRKTEEATRRVLKQSSRDMLLSLRTEIDNTLKKIIKQEVDEALTADKLVNILTEILKESIKDEHKSADIKVALSPGDLKIFQEGFISKLQEKLKKEIVMESSEDIAGGFTISYDRGKSCFDFTDESLVEYLSMFLNAEVSQLLKEAISG